MQLLFGFRLIGKDIRPMSLSNKIWHKGQGVVWAVEQAAGPVQRHGSPRFCCTVNLRAEVERSTGK